MLCVQDLMSIEVAFGALDLHMVEEPSEFCE